MALPQLDDLPLFPLGMVLFPGEAVPLHIFEYRYREMVRYCLETDEPFGIVLVEDERLASIGCTARIERVLRRYEDGRYDIVARGEDRFAIDAVKQERAYLTATAHAFGRVEPLPNPDERERVITLHMKLLELSGETIRPSIYEGPKQISFVVGQNVGLDLARKQELLELPSEQDRLQYLSQHLEQIIPEVEHARDRARRIQSNGHFKQDSA
jgi:ATP-dependent Lon protease